MKTIKTATWVFALAIILLQVPLTTKAQSPTQLKNEITRVGENGLPKNFVFRNPSIKIEDASQAKSFLLGKLKLKAPYNLHLLNQRQDKIGMQHYRFKLMYNNYPVEHTMYILHTKNGAPVSANGDYVNNISLATGTTINLSTAVEKAYAAENVNYTKGREEWIKNNLNKAAETKIIYHKATGTYKLVHEVQVVQSIGHQHKIAIDAVSGEVVRKENPFQCAKIHTIYSGERQTTTMDSAGKFWLVDKQRGIRTFDAKGASTQGQEPENAELVSSTKDEWHKDDHATGALDAHFSAQATYDYFLNKHNHKSFDGNGAEIRSYVNVDIGQQPNAFWGGFMVISKPVDDILLSTLDIVCHEITHGVSNTSAGFSNQGEAGALGEAYSDMFGSLIEKSVYTDYPDSLNYQTGEQFTQIGRDFINPERYDNPRYYKGKNWDASNQNVHGNGNVHTHWMYLVIEGDANYTNEKNENYSIAGIGREKLSNIIYRTLTNYLTPQSGFQESMLYTIQTTKDLYGACSDEVKTIKTAWRAVGLEVDDDINANAEFTANTSRCVSPVQFTFINTKGSNKTYNWNFGDGTNSTDVSPVKSFTTNGEYKITLYVEGCTGDNSTYEMTVTVDNDLKCDSNIMAHNGKESKESCVGLVRSNVGLNGIYQPNNTGEYTIRNTNNSPYEIEFLSFELGYFSDRLEIYDGIGTGGTKLGEFSVMNPPTGKIKSSTGAVTFKETSDGFSDYDGPGYEIYYTCDRKSTTNSIQDIATQTIKVWPNPTTGNLNIYNAKGIKAYNITDISGKLIEQNTVNGNSTAIKLNTYPNGMYFINVITNSGVFTEKIIVQHN